MKKQRKTQRKDNNRLLSDQLTEIRAGLGRTTVQLRSSVLRFLAITSHPCANFGPEVSAELDSLSNKVWEASNIFGEINWLLAIGSNPSPELAEEQQRIKKQAENLEALFGLFEEAVNYWQRRRSICQAVE